MRNRHEKDILAQAIELLRRQGQANPLPQEAVDETLRRIAECGMQSAEPGTGRSPLRIPHSATRTRIGLKVAAAAAILALDRIPGEAEHIKEMLIGNILFVGWREVAKIAALYAAVGLFHYVCRKKFILVSRDPEKASEQGIPVRLWDFLFYATFGLVVTSSVEIAGVLLVFSFLIIPAVCAILFTKSFRRRLFIAWTAGALTSLAGIYASGRWDLPTGAAVVCCFGLLVVGCGAAKRLFQSG